MTALFFVIVFSVSPEQLLLSTVVDVKPTLEECATRKRELEFKFAERLKENPNERIECLQLMGTV